MGGPGLIDALMRGDAESVAAMMRPESCYKVLLRADACPLRSDVLITLADGEMYGLDFVVRACNGLFRWDVMGRVCCGDEEFVDHTRYLNHEFSQRSANTLAAAVVKLAGAQRAGEVDDWLGFAEMYLRKPALTASLGDLLFRPRVA